MTITTTEFNGNNFYNAWAGNSLGTALSNIAISGVPTNSAIGLSVNYSGQAITVELTGNFDLSGYDSSQTNLASLLGTTGITNSTVSGDAITINGKLNSQDSWGSGIGMNAWLQLTAITVLPTLSSQQQVFNAPLVVNSSTGNLTGDSVYGYLGSVTYYENHTSGKWSDIVIGGSGGINTVILHGAFSAYTIAPNNYVWDTNAQASNLVGYSILENSAPSTDSALLQMSNVQRVDFGDGTAVALDIGPTQTAGSVYMLYQATFNRTPDAAGLGYWIAQVDKGANIITTVAATFVTSPEFVAKYGANPSNASYVDNLYQNVLHRAGDSGGIAYWNGQLNTGAATKAFVLEQFATLAEGAALVAPTIAHGIAYQQWVG
jgi:hypothetical protein